MPYVGELFALGAAAVWAVAVILFRRSGETMSPFSLNLFRVGVSAVLLIGVVLISGGKLVGDRPLSDFLWLAASGIVGIAISDTFFHRCLNMVGAGINAVVDCLYPPFVAVVAFLLLDEQLGPWQLAGMVLVIGGVVITTRAIPPEGTSHRDLLIGILWGVAAMATLALGVVWAKPVLEGNSVVWASCVRQVVSFAVMAPVALALPSRREIWSVFKPRPDWKFSLPGTILGSFLALLLWLAGMKYTEAGAAAILNQTSTVFILILAAIFLHEPFTARRWVAAGLALIGIAMVTFG
ncbi:MAG: DMT family transporter [Thermoanaerobaculales bacterium]|nr:DMT family transporter [Thermoanaerobaculales bacterium]